MASFYLQKNGQALGPFPELELRTMVGSGQVTLDDLVCVVGESQWRTVSSVLQFSALSGTQDSSVSTIIPYKNPAALTGYYLAVFSLIPCIGLILGIPAVILGIIGLNKARANPGNKGTGHAWTAIILGGITSLLWIGLIVAGFVGSVFDR